MLTELIGKLIMTVYAFVILHANNINILIRIIECSDIRDSDNRGSTLSFVHLDAHSRLVVGIRREDF